MFINSMKKITKLFIFLFFVHFSCKDQQSTDERCKSNCDFNLRVFSDLPAGENADYKLEWVDSNTQTFGTIKADLGCEVIKKVAWQSDYDFQYQGEWTNIVNEASYSTEDGIATTIMGVFSNFIGDVITVCCGFNDECENHFYDFITIEIVNEM